MNIWKYQWKLITNSKLSTDSKKQPTSILCMNLKQAIQENWINSFSSSSLITSQSNSELNKPAQARLWSPPIQAVHKLRCFQFVYEIDVGLKHGDSTRRLKENPTLALLRHQEG
ncbi:unnamed protein product [Trichobilharzia szidati]|nr:unnamed protein product [Trichobilharzia szidati]